MARENIRYECGCILPAPDAARSTDRRAGIRSRQDIRMDVSPFARQGLPPLVFPVERHGKKDKDLSGADSLLEPRFPLLFASWSDPERMIVMKIFFLFPGGTMQIFMYEVVGSYLMAKNNIVLFLV